MFFFSGSNEASVSQFIRIALVSKDMSLVHSLNKSFSGLNEDSFVSHWSRGTRVSKGTSSNVVQSLKNVFFLQA